MPETQHTEGPCRKCDSTLEKAYGCHVRKVGVTRGWQRWEYATEAELDRAIIAWESLGYEVA